MVNYMIEGGIDFFKELQDIQGVILETNDSNECLLTGTPLTPDHITLECGHKFNYKPLFVEVLMQKCSVLPKSIASTMTASYVNLTNNTNNTNNIINTNNTLNTDNNVVVHYYNSSINMETTKLSYNEIKCPYCRTITPKLLPYYPYPDIKQIRYVNSPSNLCMPSMKCCYYDNKLSDKVCNNLPTYDESFGMLCKTHLKMMNTKPSHTSKSKYNSIHKVNTKVNTKVKDENIIVSVNGNDNNDTTKCSYILTSGNRKGSMCGVKVYENTDEGKEHNNTKYNKGSLCKRHHIKLFALELPGKICKGHNTGDGLDD